TEMARLSKPHRLKIYPSFGRSVEEGHSLVYLSVGTWESEGFAFLDERMRRQQLPAAREKCDFSRYKPLRLGTREGKSIVKEVVPNYPPSAKKRRVQGLVVVRVLTNENGTVVMACVESGPHPLRAASKEAALKTVFEPVLLNGKKVPYVEQQI